MHICEVVYKVRLQRLVLATGPGDPAAVRVWTAKTGRFGSRPVQDSDPLALGRPNQDPYLLTRGFHRVWLDPLVPISGSAFWDVHNEATHAPNHILNMSINSASRIFGLASSVI